MYTHTIAVAALAIGIFAASSMEGASAGSSRVATQCLRGERIFYSCNLAKGTVSVCVKGDRVSYRFGPLGKPKIEISGNGTDGKAFRDDAVGAEGGHQGAVRFVNHDYSYIVFAGTAGGLSDRPGMRWSGVAIYKGHKRLETMTCKTAGPQQDMPVSPGVLPDETDELFDVWY